MRQSKTVEPMDRRQFLTKTGRTALGIAAGATVLRPGTRAVAANEKFVVGLMGVRGRGVELVQQLVKRRDVEISYLCDVDSNVYGDAFKVDSEGLCKKHRNIGSIR